MTPARDEHQWTVVLETTVNDGCLAPDCSIPSSESSFTLDGSSETSGSRMANEASSGREGEASSSDTDSLGSPSNDALIPHDSGHEDRYQDPVNSQAGSPIVQENLPRSIHHPNTNTVQGISPIPIDHHRQIPRKFPNFQGADLLTLFPDFFKGKPPSEVEEWVQRCDSSGADIPPIDTSMTDRSTYVARQQRSNTRNLRNNQQNGSDMSSSDKSKPAYRQIDTHPQNEDYEPNDVPKEEHSLDDDML